MYTDDGIDDLKQKLQSAFMPERFRNLPEIRQGYVAGWKRIVKTNPELFSRVPPDVQAEIQGTVDESWAEKARDHPYFDDDVWRFVNQREIPESAIKNPKWQEELTEGWKNRSNRLDDGTNINLMSPQARSNPEIIQNAASSIIDISERYTQYMNKIDWIVRAISIYRISWPELFQAVPSALHEARNALRKFFENNLQKAYNSDGYGNFHTIGHALDIIKSFFENQESVIAQDPELYQYAANYTNQESQRMNRNNDFAKAEMNGNYNDTAQWAKTKARIIRDLNNIAVPSPEQRANGLSPFYFQDVLMAIFGEDQPLAQRALEDKQISDIIFSKFGYYEVTSLKNRYNIPLSPGEARSLKPNFDQDKSDFMTNRADWAKSSSWYGKIKFKSIS